MNRYRRWREILYSPARNCCLTFDKVKSYEPKQTFICQAQKLETTELLLLIAPVSSPRDNTYIDCSLLLERRPKPKSHCCFQHINVYIF